MSMLRPIRLVPIAPGEFQSKMHALFHWNMEPLSVDEKAQADDGLSCPVCKKMRYVMWQTVNSQYDHLFLFTGPYCTCPHTQEVSSEEAGTRVV